MCISSDLMQKNSISRIRQTKFGLLGLTETWTTPTQNLIFLFFLSQGLSALVSVLIQLGDWSVIAKHWDSKMSFITLGTAFCRFKDKSVKGFAYEINLHNEEFFKVVEFNKIEMSKLPSAHDRVRSPGYDESNHVDHWHLQSFHHLWLWLWLWWWWWFWFWRRSVPSSLVDLRSPGGLMTRESVAAGFSVQSHCCHHSQLDFHVTEQNPMAKCKCK